MSIASLGGGRVRVVCSQTASAAGIAGMKKWWHVCLEEAHRRWHVSRVREIGDATCILVDESAHRPSPHGFSLLLPLVKAMSLLPARSSWHSSVSLARLLAHLMLGALRDESKTGSIQQQHIYLAGICSTFHGSSDMFALLPTARAGNDGS